MNPTLSTISPDTLLILLLLGVPIVCLCIGALAVSIIFAFRGNATASQAALDTLKGAAATAAIDALHKSGVSQRMDNLSNQINTVAMAVPPPGAIASQPAVAPLIEQTINEGKPNAS